MTENEVIKILKIVNEDYFQPDNPNEFDDINESLEMAIQALEEIQQYRAYKEIFESHFSKEALELLSDKTEFGKWLERGKWIAKKCDEINRKVESFEAIGAIDEFKALKEKEERFDRNIKMFNEIGLEIRNNAIAEFAERLKTDYVNFDLYYILQDNNFAFENTSLKSYQDMINEIAEEMRGAE